MNILEGRPASPGLTIGKVLIFDPDRIELRRRTLVENEADEEVFKFTQAIESTISDLRNIKSNVARDLGSEEAAIFETHLMMLQDKVFIDRVIENIRVKKQNADAMVHDVLCVHHDALQSTKDEYLKERAADIRDIRRRVIQKIQGKDCQKTFEIIEPSIITSRELTPSLTVTLDRKKILGFATELGGRTSHAAILAKALEVPSVVGIAGLMESINQGDTLIVDGTHGKVVINPNTQFIKQYEIDRDGFNRYNKSLESEIGLSPETLDGRTVELSANIELPEEIDSVLSHGSQGIGLFRTEYLFMFRDQLPDEEEQYQAYLKIAKRVAPYPVIIRTIDIGGDKVLEIQGNYSREANPFLGWRSIRFCLSNPDIFRTQLRAILRSSVQKNVKIMFPLISGLAELRQAKSFLEEIKNELEKENVPFNKSIELGIMIETPSAALTAEHLAKEVKFFSIGTNDLMQYVLAVDRSNPKVSNLYQFFHPAVLKLIEYTITTGHKAGIWVGMCGEMAADPVATLLLVGMGLDEFSVSPLVLPEIKRIIRSSTYTEAKKIRNACKNMDTAEEIETYLTQTMMERFPDLPI